MKVLAVCCIFVAIAVVWSAHCGHGNDASQCTGLTCSNAMEEVGCEHGMCTCVQKAIPCLDGSECANATCEHKDQNSHCVDGNCHCIHM